MINEQALQELEALRRWNDTTAPIFKERVRALYTQVTGKTLRNCNCKNVYSDALIEIYSRLKSTQPQNKKSDMSNKQARLVRGVVIQRNGNHYTNANITDEIASSKEVVAEVAENPTKTASKDVESENKPTTPKKKKTSSKRK